MKSCLAILLVLIAGPLAGCSGDKTYAAHGTVREVSLDEGQVLVAHDEIEGLMPAMTMNFAIYDPDLLERLSPGDVIDFELTASRGSFYISRASVVGQASADEGWVRMGDVLVKADPAPGFALIDQDGASRTLDDLAGRVLVLDFMFTRCPGPCPINTSNLVAVQRSLSAAVLAKSHFVSISLDPLRDRPADMGRYARSHGADLTSWSFLTGSPEAVDPVLRAYGVGTSRGADEEIEHILVTFLIDGRGQIVKRYIGQDYDPAGLAADVQALVATSEDG